MKKVLMSALVLFFLGTGTLYAQQPQGTPCVLRHELIKHLLEKFQEVQTAMGFADNGTLFEIFASPTGTWTAAMTMPNGVSCLVATGEDFEVLRTKPPEAPSDPA